jgi:nucleolar pre-ribosomal-associated protein 1
MLFIGTALSSVARPASTKHGRIIAAYELIDWLRLIDQPLSIMEVRRLSDILVKFHMPSLLEFGEHLDPTRVSFWDALALVSRYSELRLQ